MNNKVIYFSVLFVALVASAVLFAACGQREPVPAAPLSNARTAGDPPGGEDQGGGENAGDTRDPAGDPVPGNDRDGDSDNDDDDGDGNAGGGGGAGDGGNAGGGDGAGGDDGDDDSDTDSDPPTPDPLQCGGIRGLGCDRGEVCNINFCAADADGVCAPRPTLNECRRTSNFTGRGGDGLLDFVREFLHVPAQFCSAFTFSNCPPVLCRRNCIQPPGCGINGFCPTVCSDTQGSCIPAWLPPSVKPVCGCDGLTYENDCYRLRAGVAFAYDGFCRRR